MAAMLAILLLAMSLPGLRGATLRALRVQVVLLVLGIYVSDIETEPAVHEEFANDFAHKVTVRIWNWKPLSEAIIGQYLLATDFFPERQPRRKVKYLGLLRPYDRPCGNPLARHA